MLHFYMYIPENIQKYFGFLFSGVWRENIGLKWVSLYICKLLE